MHGIVGALPARQMALRISAVGRLDGQRIVIVDVAQRASYAGVAIGQQESGRTVIENTRSPSRNWMARGAGRRRRREPGRYVVGNIAANGGRALKRRRMATVAIRRIQRVIVIDVAGGAGRRRRRHVCSGQRKSSCAVIKDCGSPTHRTVANRAIRSSERGTGS